MMTISKECLTKKTFNNSGNNMGLSLLHQKWTSVAPDRHLLSSMDIAKELSPNICKANKI